MEVAVRNHFALAGTFLEKVLQEGKPTHVPDVPATARSQTKFRLLQVLAQRDLRDAIFLPVTSQSPVPGVLVFATRQHDAYTPEHLELLSNLAHLVSHSFGRTVRLAEHTRLAAIGEFASGIALRWPRSTWRWGIFNAWHCPNRHESGWVLPHGKPSVWRASWTICCSMRSPSR